MNLLPHSNGVRRVNMKRQRTTKEKLKNMAKVLMGIIIAGFIIFIRFYSQIKKQNVLLSDLIDTIKEKNENTDKKEENV